MGLASNWDGRRGNGKGERSDAKREIRRQTKRPNFQGKHNTATWEAFGSRVHLKGHTRVGEMTRLSATHSSAVLLAVLPTSLLWASTSEDCKRHLTAITA
jgi:hypothetical protein